MFSRPLLSDLPATRYSYKPGDRVLVRVSVTLTRDQYAKIERAVKKWCGADIRVLIVNCLQVRILWHRQDGHVETLACSEDAENKGIDLGVANLNCSVTDLKAGEKLMFFVPWISSDIQRDMITRWVQEWSGKDVEVVVQAGL